MSSFLFACLPWAGLIIAIGVIIDNAREIRRAINQADDLRSQNAHLRTMLREHHDELVRLTKERGE